MMDQGRLVLDIASSRSVSASWRPRCAVDGAPGQDLLGTERYGCIALC